MLKLINLSKSDIKAYIQRADLEAAKSMKSSPASITERSIAVIRLDENVPNSLRLLEGIKLKTPRTEVIYIGEELDTNDLVALFRAGLSDYLLHPVNQADIDRAIKRIDEKHQRIQFDPDIFKLTKREVQVCKLLVKGVMSKDIASQLNITPATIKIHKSRIMKKVSVKSLPDLVRIASF